MVSRSQLAFRFSFLQEFEALLNDVVHSKRLSASKMNKLTEIAMKSLEVRRSNPSDRAQLSAGRHTARLHSLPHTQITTICLKNI